MKTRKKISISTRLQGYDVTIGKDGYFYRNEKDLLAGLLYHLTTGDNNPIDTMLANKILDSYSSCKFARSDKNTIAKLHSHISSLETIVANKQKKIESLMSIIDEKNYLIKNSCHTDTPVITAQMKRDLEMQRRAEEERLKHEKELEKRREYQRAYRLMKRNEAQRERYMNDESFRKQKRSDALLHYHENREEICAKRRDQYKKNKKKLISNDGK